MSNQALSSRNQPTESGGLQIFELPVFGYEANGLQSKPIIFILQKDEYQNGCFKKTKHAKFFTRTCAYQGVRNVHFLEKFGVLCFLETPVLKFVFLLYYQRSLYFRLMIITIKATMQSMIFFG